MDAGETRKSAFPRETEIRDGLFEDEAPVVRLSRFEGPLDLLLFLIRKNEIDVCDIPIESVTRQYLEILHGNERLDLDVAGDFFVMAATLMHIKSRMLLPTSENVPEENDAGTDGEEDPDPRWELVRQLIQYKRLKESSRRIAELAAARQRYADRAIVPEDAPEERPVAPVGRMDLWNVFNLVLKRLADRILPGEIQGDAVRVEKSFSFSSLLPEKLTVSVLVSTFLACLELARLGEIIVRQDEIFAEIYCEAREEGAADPFPPRERSEADDALPLFPEKT